ncbi:MAG: right-handed parallel beta-helix repeat-containing protein [Caldilineaceae bacterium]
MRFLRKIRQQLLIASLALTALITPAAPAYANQDAPAAASVFTVVYNFVDNNNADGALTLREALLLARGGTGPKGLNRSLTTSEMNYIQGCDFLVNPNDGGKAVIIGGCGEGVSDTIRFKIDTVHLPNDDHFVINSSLPPIDDSQPTIVDGESSGARPYLDFSSNNNTQGLEVKSGGNVIKGVIVVGNHCAANVFCTGLAGITLTGNNNQVTNVFVYLVSGYGIQVKGQGNTIDNARLGLFMDNQASCLLAGLASSGMMRAGIYIDDGAKNSTVKNSLVGCNGGNDGWSGIEVGANTQGTVIGPNNRVGTNGSAGVALLGNGDYGIALFNATQVKVISNTVGYNGEGGIGVLGSSNNLIANNLVRNNHGDGIALILAANNNQIGSGNYGANKIGLNDRHGIYLGADPSAPDVTPIGNQIVNNWIGTLDVVKKSANNGSGIVADGASNNQIGDLTPNRNIIGGNDVNGILLTKGAHDNTLVNNYIGVNAFSLIGNGGSGIMLDQGAHNNVIGGSDPKAGNVIAASGFAGVVLHGATTTENLFVRNTIHHNQVAGMLVMGGANNNSIGGIGLFGGLVNGIASNDGPGLLFEEGAHHNLVGGNTIYDNLGAGVSFSGAATQHNHIELAKISANRSVNGDGIAQSNGAANNYWSQISSYDNGGLGIDLNAIDLNNQSDAPYPTITQIGVTTDTVIVTGNATPSNANQTVTVEVYRSAADPSGFGEGQTFIGSTEVASNGFFATGTKGLAGCFTAFQTISTNTGKTSSEFGKVMCKGSPQTITFADIADKFVKDPPITITPTASSALPVEVEATGPCSVQQNQVTLMGEGQCTLIARQAGNANVAPAPDKVVQFAINKKAQTITWQLSDAEKQKMVNDAAFALSASASSGLPVTFVAQGYCTVNGNLVTLTGESGSCFLTAQQAGDDEYLAASEVEAEISVSKLAQSINFAPLPNKLTSDPAFALSATASSGLPVSFMAEGVCTVDAGSVTLSGQAGFCTLTATQVGDAVYKPAAEVTQILAVSDPAKQNQTINFALLAGKTLGDAGFVLNASATSGLPVQFASLTPATCSVDNGQVTLATSGVCTIQASQPGDASYNPAPDVAQSFVIADPAKQNQTISFDVIAGKQLGDAPLTINPTASSGLSVAVVSETAAVCTVANSLVTLLAAGECRLVATQAGDATFNPAPPLVRAFIVQVAGGQAGDHAIYLPLINR